MTRAEAEECAAFLNEQYGLVVTASTRETYPDSGRYCVYVWVNDDPGSPEAEVFNAALIDWRDYWGRRMDEERDSLFRFVNACRRFERDMIEHGNLVLEAKAIVLEELGERV